MASNGVQATIAPASSGNAKELALQQAAKNADSSGGLMAQLSGNPFFTAGAGLAGLGAALSIARKGVTRGASLLRRRLLVDVEINVKDDSYKWFLWWMTLHQRAQLPSSTAATTAANTTTLPANRGMVSSILQRIIPRMHHLSIMTEKATLPNGSTHTNFTLVPGPGKHIIRYQSAFLLVDRQRETSSTNVHNGQPWETVTLTTLYSHRHIFESLFREAHALAERAHEGKTLVYHPKSVNWEQFGEPRRKRNLESVILDEGVKERIVGDVKDFLASGKWYHERGIPYRRGYLLHGPPGSGKTSFIQALAGELDYSIAMLNLSERGLTDDRLAHLLSVIPPRTLVLLEDADAAFGNRRQQVDEHGYAGANVTFSGLLNAMDGVASAEERILFLTTNHIERMDPALVRPGRVDMTVRLGDATPFQVKRFWERFYGDVDEGSVWKDRFLKRLEELGAVGKEDGSSETVVSFSTAALQGLFLYNKGDMKGAVDMAAALVPDAAGHGMKQKGAGSL